MYWKHWLAEPASIIIFGKKLASIGENIWHSAGFKLKSQQIQKNISWAYKSQNLRELGEKRGLNRGLEIMAIKNIGRVVWLPTNSFFDYRAKLWNSLQVHQRKSEYWFGFFSHPALEISQRVDSQNMEQ